MSSGRVDIVLVQLNGRSVEKGASIEFCKEKRGLSVSIMR
jgi:hypothetical protein